MKKYSLFYMILTISLFFEQSLLSMFCCCANNNAVIIPTQRQKSTGTINAHNATKTPKLEDIHTLEELLEIHDLTLAEINQFPLATHEDRKNTKNNPRFQTLENKLRRFNNAITRKDGTTLAKK